MGAAGKEGAERASVWLDVLCANLVGGGVRVAGCRGLGG